MFSLPGLPACLPAFIHIHHPPRYLGVGVDVGLEIPIPSSIHPPWDGMDCHHAWAFIVVRRCVFVDEMEWNACGIDRDEWRGKELCWVAMIFGF